MEMTKKKIDTNYIKDFFEKNSILILIIIMALYVGFTQKNFFSISNAKNLASNTSVRFIIACGVSGCLITRGTDLSAGRMVGFSACICATLLQKTDYASKFFPGLGDIPVIGGLLCAIIVCAFFGAISGLIIAFLKVPPFITTLGMQTFIYGICSVYTGSQPLGGFKSTFTGAASGSLFGVPYLVIYALIIGGLMWFLYNKTRHGKYMYAIGGNEHAAEVAGINVAKVQVKIYALAACLYAIAGFLVAAKSGGASVATGLGYELEAIAACTIGGVSTNGGVGKVSGILIGVLVFETLKICLQFLGVDPAYTYVAQGLVIIVAVALDLRKYIAKK